MLSTAAELWSGKWQFEAGVCRRTPPLCAGEAVALQDVVGECVPEHDGADLFDAAHAQLSQVPVAPAGMDALAYRAGLVSDLARFARHSGAPGQHPRAVAAPRQVWVGAM